MRIDWDVPITMDDGLVLRADVFRPVEDGRYPVILSYGPYAKGLHFEDGYPDQWRIMCEKHPDVPAGSSNLYQAWEVVDPEKWVPEGYACVRVDSRGAGRSPGYIQHFSPRETQDFHDCIEWAGEQSWSNGKVGLSGISYYGMNQWQVAATQPEHLSAMCVWEGAADWYRDAARHGRLLSTFWANWYGCRPATGAATACTCAATPTATRGCPRRTSGSRCTASRTGRTSTPTTAARSSSGSSTTSSRVRTTAGTTRRGRSSTSDTSMTPTRCATSLTGRYRRHSGRSCGSIRIRRSRTAGCARRTAGWPTCIVIPEGWTLALTVQGHDYQYSPDVQQVGWFTMTGVGPFKHDDPSDRPEERYGGRTTLVAGGDRDAYLLLPFIP